MTQLPVKRVCVSSEAKTLSEAAREGAAVLRSGGLVAYPTESFYGLAANVADESAILRLFDLKQRKPDQPLLILIDAISSLKRYAAHVSKDVEKLLELFWPGGLTLIFEATKTVSPLLTAETGKIGIRLSSHFVPKALARALGSAITGTSANISGTPPSGDPDAVMESFQQGLGLLLDGGKTTAQAASTVLDVTVTPFRVLREGMIPRDVLSAHCEVR